MDANGHPAPDRLSRLIERVFFHLAGFCLAALFLTMLAGVVLRYLPVPMQAEHWVPGILNLFQVWLTLFGTVAAVVSRHHLRIAFIVERLSARAGRVVGWLIWAIRIATVALILQASFRIVETGFDASIGGVPFTKGHIYVALPLCLAVIILLELIAALRRRPEGTR